MSSKELRTLRERAEKISLSDKKFTIDFVYGEYELRLNGLYIASGDYEKIFNALLVSHETLSIILTN